MARDSCGREDCLYCSRWDSVRDECRYRGTIQDETKAEEYLGGITPRCEVFEDD